MRTVTIDHDHPISYELCGGTHVENTGEIGLFIITSEGSAAAGIRRIEAVTGWQAYEIIRSRSKTLRRAARILNTSPDEVVVKINALQNENESLRIDLGRAKQQHYKAEFVEKIGSVTEIAGTPFLAVQLEGADIETLRQLTDTFRQKFTSGIVAIGSISNDKPMIICAVTDDLVKRGVNAGELVRHAAGLMGGSGGGRPILAQAGGRDASKLPEALQSLADLVRQKLTR